MGDIFEHRIHIRGKNNSFYIWFCLYNKDSRPYIKEDFVSTSGRLAQKLIKEHYDAGHAISTQGFELNGSYIVCLYYGASQQSIRYFKSTDAVGRNFPTSNVDYLIDTVTKLY